MDGLDPRSLQVGEGAQPVFMLFGGICIMCCNSPVRGLLKLLINSGKEERGQHSPTPALKSNFVW